MDIFDDLHNDADGERVDYKIELAKSLGGPVVVVSFFGFVDEEQAKSFAEYMMVFLELNRSESPSGLIH